MASVARRAQRSTNIWPGFVDALATLLMVIIFLLMVFVLAQFFLNEAITGRDTALRKLESRVGELADLLSLERLTNDDLRDDLQRLSRELQVSVALRDDLRTTVGSFTSRAEQAEERVRALSLTVEADREKILDQLKEMADLTQEVEALKALRAELEEEVAAMAEKAWDAETARKRAEESLDQEKLSRARALEEERRRSERILLEERKISGSARAQIALLNRQLAALRNQLEKIAAALDASEVLATEQKIEITTLGRRLNAALATKVQELSRYRSEFFGRLREVLGDRQGVRIVGDRFVFQSELLFETGSDEMGEDGKRQVDHLAETLVDITLRIPDDIDWVLRVDGHTDKIPINTFRFPSNWELSTARAISVVKYMISLGIPPKRLVAAGFGEFQPLDDRGDEIAHRRNRRIEFKLTQR